MVRSMLSRGVVGVVGLVGVVLALAPARADTVFQWRVELPLGDRKAEAYLWVPPAADRIRGVLVGLDTLFEGSFVKDPAIRDACAREKLAIVQITAGGDAIFNYKAEGFKGGENLEGILQAAAEKSGYREIAVAPWFTYGHSVSTMFACHAATWKPERTFGFLSFKGGVDEGTDPAKYASVPALAIKGEFEEFGPAGPLRKELNEDRTTSWTVMKETLVALRGRNDANLFSGLLEPGATHFRWADDTYGAYVALFIRKAAQRRIPGDWPVDAKEVRCLAIDPATGGLSSSDVFDAKRPAAAAYKEYKGDPKKAFWHLDEEMARATDAYYAKHMLGKKAQFVAFADPKSGNPIAVGHDLRGGFAAMWTGPDTFKVATTFVDKVPRYYPAVPEPVGHAEGTPKVYAYTNVYEQVGELEFRPNVTGRRLKIETDKDGNPSIAIRGDLIAIHHGDTTYRHAEQMGRNKMASPKGKAQTLTFDPLPKAVKADAAPLPLVGKADSGLPVRFYVESGPALIKGNTLTVTDVPARGEAFEIVVVAYQYGSQVEPKFSPAPPVKQTITVKR